MHSDGDVVTSLHPALANRKGNNMGMLLLIILILLLVGAIPRWPHSKGWGYAPSGTLAVVLVVVVVLLLLGHL